MGTETYDILRIHLLVFHAQVKFIDPLMGTETDFKIFDIVAFVYVALNLLIP